MAILLVTMYFAFAMVFSAICYLITKKFFISSISSAICTSFMAQWINYKLFGPDKFYIVAILFSAIYFFISSSLLLVVLMAISNKKYCK